MKSRTVFLLFACLALLSWSVTSVAACASAPSAGVWNSAAGYQNITYTTAGTDLLGKFWIDTASTANNSGATSQALMLSGNGQASGLAYPYCTWATGTFSGVHPSPWDLAGSVSCDRTVFLYSNYNSGNPQFLVMSVKGQSDGNFDFDKVTNGSAPGNILNPIAMPKVTTASRVAVAGGNDYTVSWTAVANPKGYYDSAPANNIITGVAVYYYNGAGAPSGTANYAITNASWILASGGPSSRTGYVTFTGAAADPGTATVFIPTGAPNPTYVALELLFDGQAPSQAGGFYPRTDFVGAATSVAAPTPAGLFVQQSSTLAKGIVTTSWRTNVESGVAQFEVYFSQTSGGTYAAVKSTVTAPKGNSSSYSVSFPNPGKTGATGYFKIKASMTSGPDEWSDVMSVASRGK